MDWNAALVIVTALGLGGNAVLVMRSSSKTQGALETGLKSVSDKLDEHASRTGATSTRRTSASIAWSRKATSSGARSASRTESLGYLQGKVNGKAAGGAH
jgi:hypothetical protein